MGLSVPDSPPIDAQTVADVLSEIADITSETIELREVFPRVASAVRRLIPFDNMGVARIVDGDRVVLHATTIDCQDPGEKCSEPLPLTAWSPRWRPHAGATHRIDDAPAELDASFELDADVLASGMRSGLWEPFRRGDTFAGGVWLCGFSPHAFTDAHQEVLRPIAALLGAAIEHWKIWDREQQRQDRLERIEALLATLAESLDVREVFQRLSDGMQPSLPHDMMVLTELDLTTSVLRVSAHTGAGEIPIPPEGVRLTEAELARRREFEILRDIPAEIAPDTERNRLVLASGMRSWLRVPVRLAGETTSSLGFFHHEPGRFEREDAAVARRLADRIALSRSFHRLSEEASVAARERERAQRLEATVETLSRELESRGRGPVIGRSRSWKEIQLAVGRVATSDTTVLITGESGTGKEVVSSMIHQGSARARKPFVAINCAALPEQLLESELFGHERGAFTGAAATKIGRLEQAAGGTLFLDEIAEMSPLVQAKFLRVLEAREFQRLGGTRTLRTDVRVVAATNRDLSAAIERGTFREDLFYRLNVFQIHIPPLRERTEDILPLADAFLADLGKSMGRPSAGISSDAREWLLSHPWPGNVRELRNAVERAILMCDGGLITREHFPRIAPANGGNGHRPGHRDGHRAERVPVERDTGNGHANGGEAVHLDVVERDAIARALEQAGGNKSKAARLLGLSRAQLYWRLEKHGLQ